MSLYKKCISATVVLSVLLLASFNVTADDMVNNYVRSSSAEVWKNSFGECWRSRFMETNERLQECGYAAAVEEVIETKVETPPAKVEKIIEKVYETISINASLLFGFDSADLSSDAKSVIDQHMEKYKGKGELTEKVSVVGHTDSTGPEAYNQKLSERRAASVAKYLEQHASITDTDIDVSGKGETMPVASNATREGRAKNRRVDITLEGKIEK